MSNTEIWLTVKQTSELTNIADRTIRDQAIKGKLQSKKELTNGGEAYMIALSSLPHDVQLKYYKQGSSLLPAVIKTEIAEAEPIKESIELTEYQIEVMTWRTYVVNKYIEAVSFLEYGERASAKEKFMLDYRYDPYFDFPRRILKEFSIKTLERWKEAFINSGRKSESLAPAYNYMGSRNYIGISEEEQSIILKNLLNTNGKLYSEVIRESMEEFKYRDLPYKRSEATYLRFINAWRKRNYGTFLLGRKGQKALNDQNTPSLDRDFDKIDVGDAVVIDGHNLNFTVMNPATGKAERMIFIMVIDMKSWVPLGWEIMPTENVYSITSALRRAIRNLGFLPRAVYIDNGRANKSKKFMGDKKKRKTLEPHKCQKWFQGDLAPAVGMFESLGIKKVIAKPYHGQSKIVERFFGIFSELERRMMSYTGTSIENKPPRLLRNEKLHLKLWKQEWNLKLSAGRETPAPEINEAMIFIAMWISEYIQRAHRSGKQKGLSPAEVFVKSIEKVKASADFEARLISEERLKRLMMNVTITKLYKEGIRLPRRGYYWSDEFFNYDKEKGRIKFLVRYDMLETKTIDVYDAETGKRICEARLKTQVHPLANILGTQEEIDEVKRQNVNNSRLIKGAYEKLKAIYAAPEPDIPFSGESQKLIEIRNADKGVKKKSDEDEVKISSGKFLDLKTDEPEETNNNPYGQYDFKTNEAV